MQGSTCCWWQSANPGAAGSAITFTATVSGAPAGTINFRSGGITIAGCGAVTLVSGNAQCTTTYSTIGTRTIDADYSGNARNAPSTGTLSGGQSVITPTIVLSPTSLPNGTFNAAYNQTISASGGTAAYSFTVSSGALPGGLSLSTAGVLSGTASAGGMFNFTVTATDANAFTGARLYSLTIVGASQTVTFTPASPVIFGASAITLSATASSGLTAFTFSTSSAASICTVSSNQLTIVGGGTCALTATQAGNANFASAFANANVVINAASQTVSFAPATPVTFGASAITLSATASSGLTAFTFSTSSATSICTVSSNQLTIVGGGTCALTATQAGNANFSSAFANANVVINAASQTVTFAPSSPVTVGVTPITLTASSTSALTAFTFSTSSASSICTVSINQLTIVGAGTCALTATQAGNANYAMASANTNVVINAAVQTLTVSLTGTGQGSVTGTGINCPGDCSEAVVQGTMITLTATAATGSTFTGWSGGGCTGMGTCIATMSTATTVTAQFTRQLGSLNVTLGGLPAGGSVSLAISGPDGYSTSQIVTTGTTLNLSNLPTGTYLVNAPAKTISTVFYLPNLGLNSAAVNAGITTNITITYRVALNSVAPVIYFLLED